MKVGSEDPEDDIMRAKAIREEIGDDNFLMMDANQKWDVPEAIEYVHSFGNTRHTHARCIIYQMYNANVKMASFLCLLASLLRFSPSQIPPFP